jgi:peptidoglycan/LPS O-acetylase OafA/YrhL
VALLLGLAAIWVLAPVGGAWAMSRAFLPAAACYFALGLASGLWLRGRGLGWLVLCLAACCLLGGGGEKLLIPLAWACVLAMQTGRLGAVLESRAMLWLGAISYPLYLVNEPVQRALALLIAPQPVPFTPVWLPLALGVPVLVAWALHVVVEAPFAGGQLALLPSRSIRPI